MQEIRKDIDGYEGYYQVSNLGRVKSIDRKIEYKRHKNKTTMKIRKSKILNLVKTKNGYIRAPLSKKCKTKLHFVHRLVAQAFIPNTNNLREVNHIDCNKENNCVDNLEWVSSKENKIHAIKNHLCLNMQKPILQMKNEIVIKRFDSIMDAVRELGINNRGQNIGKVALGKRKSAYGYQRKYDE